MNNKKSNIIIILMAIIIIILLVLCVLFATGTISLNNNSVDDNTENKVDNDVLDKKDMSLTQEEINNYKNIANQRFEEMLLIAHKANYCGETALASEDYFEERGDDYYRYYIASKDYKTIEELKSYISSILSEDLISKYFNYERGYKEKDGKLYYLSSLKDCGYDFVYNGVNISNDMIDISDVSGTSFKATLKFKYTVGCTSEEHELTANMVLTKKGDNYLITSYEDDAIYDVKY